MAKKRVNVIDPKTDKNRVGVYDDVEHLIKISNGKKLKPKNTKVNSVFND